VPNPSRCVILVPVGGPIEPGCEDGLRELERRGYPVWRVRGYSQIDVGRNQMASEALAQGFDELFWIDSDMVFQPEDVERLRAHRLPLVCGLYPKKSLREFACSFLPETQKVQFGPHGGLVEILYCGFGFALTRRELHTAMEHTLSLPVCNEGFGSRMVPYFQPLVVPHGNGHWYLGEDYAFCERARRCGVKVLADAAVRLWHVGTYQFGWEDAGGEKERFAHYCLNLTDAKRTPG
jgi:hypothetical protein